MSRILLVLVPVIATVGLSFPTVHAADELPKNTDYATFSPKCGDQDYIQKGEWVYRDNEWTLSLTPTDCGRNIGPSQTPNMFYEISKKFAGSPYWSNTRGMINQLTCHLAIARDKPEWNLDPWRPYVGYSKTAAAKCNVTQPDPDSEFH
ncbi:DUF2599 domain-containing protein [Pseudomonas sp. UBA1879]|uniref:DUF2599 domain-containing protein n=1 Tax=Pseudomonas sp. UBA1879 TaxID=1947305 RepID=UPI0025F4E3A7|nr:DUF2599 domain-containing protein [Pseudomonas sp. UBA1879]